MKEYKSKGLRRAFLMVVAATLVVTISVGATLAYLTAQTDEKVNTFTANAEGLTGKFYEPSFTQNKTGVKPGDRYAKDPMIQNETEADKMYVGVKMTFKINGISVPYSTFKKFVALYTDSEPNYATSGTDQGYADAFNTDTDGWTKVTTTDTSGPLYFVYNKQLDAAIAGDPTATYISNGTDVTDPIFKNVKLNPDIVITGTDSGVDSDNATSLADLPALTADNKYNFQFEKMNFEVALTGYGVSATTYNTIGTAKPVILTGLGTSESA